MLSDLSRVGVARGRVLGLVIAAGAAGVASAQTAQDSVFIDLVGAGIIAENGVFPDQTRTSILNPGDGTPEVLNPADGYFYDIDGVVETILFGFVNEGLSGNVSDLFALLADNAGASLLTGYVRAPEPGTTTTIWREVIGGDFGIVQVGITFEITVESDGEVIVNLSDITNSFGTGFSTELQSGGAFVEKWEPSAAQFTEFHFDGDLGAFEGPAQMRYLDDPAFGEVLGGTTNNNLTPQPLTPTGVTEMQSSFIDTAMDPSIPAPGGVDDIVYMTSPSYNLSNPASADLRRGIGLLFWPNAKPIFPGDFIGQWSMVVDMYVPSASAAGRTRVAPLINTSPWNSNGAELWLFNGPSGLSLRATLDAEDFNVPEAVLGVSTDTWFRLAVVADEYQQGTSRVYVDGAFVGTVTSDWIYNGVDPRDGLRTFINGTPILDADWTQWGEFPSPWATTNDGTTTFGISSTVPMFADNAFSDDAPVLIANMLFVDELLDDIEVAELGGASGDGIVFLKSEAGGCSIADLDENNSIDVFDLISFLQNFDPMAACPGAAACSVADLDGNDAIDVFDLILFLQNFDPANPDCQG